MKMTQYIGAKFKSKYTAQVHIKRVTQQLI